MLKKFFSLVLFITIICTGCINNGNAPLNDNGNVNALEEMSIITIPESYFSFTNTVAEDEAKSYSAYCGQFEVSEGNLILYDVTVEQKEKLLKKNNSYKEEVIEAFQNANPEYVYEISEDFRQVVYKYDEHIEMSLQLEVLGGLTSAFVFENIVTNNVVDWDVNVVVKNCHTDNVVVSVHLPENTLSFGAEEWEESYNE